MNGDTFLACDENSNLTVRKPTTAGTCVLSRCSPHTMLLSMLLLVGTITSKSWEPPESSPIWVPRCENATGPCHWFLGGARRQRQKGTMKGWLFLKIWSSRWGEVHWSWCGPLLPALSQHPHLTASAPQTHMAEAFTGIHVRTEESANFFCWQPESEYFQLCGPESKAVTDDT